jgi:hypothetical protein
MRCVALRVLGKQHVLAIDERIARRVMRDERQSTAEWLKDLLLHPLPYDGRTQSNVHGIQESAEIRDKSMDGRVISNQRAEVFWEFLPGDVEPEHAWGLRADCWDDLGEQELERIAGDDNLKYLLQQK